VVRPRPHGRSAFAAAVQAQRREAWDEPPPDAGSSVVRPRPHGRSAYAAAVQAQRREAWGKATGTGSPEAGGGKTQVENLCYEEGRGP
jgi:hypothetical protein